ncbi:MAG: ATP--cob(I)alamin adenosyltransferase [Candidatus Poribacteria bacterium]|nr:MAG: ATP--cob(I)alamin adenosyltransferase [Candidatus Poribacteria bacterium]
MRIYTRRGDEGKTDLFGGGRVSKDALRVEAYGAVDELNAVVGLVLAQEGKPLDEDVREDLSAVQAALFELGADLATPRDHPRVRRIGPEEVAALEARIDAYSQELPPLRAFLLPGGSPAAAWLHLARTVCRRAERCVVRLSRQESVNPEALRYLNRLSDLFFVLARVANVRGGVPEVEWRPQKRESKA